MKKQVEHKTAREVCGCAPCQKAYEIGLEAGMWQEVEAKATATQKPKRRKGRGYWKREAKNACHSLGIAEACIEDYGRELREMATRIRVYKEEMPVLEHRLEMVEQSRDLYKRRFLIGEGQFATLQEEMWATEQQIKDTERKLSKIRRLYEEWIAGDPPELSNTIGRMFEIGEIVEGKEIGDQRRKPSLR